MTVALIKTNPKVIVAAYSSRPQPLVIPNETIDPIYGADIGWTSQDGRYALVAVTAFIAPAGQVITGAPSYALVNGNVVETYATQPAPLNVIAFSDFINRWLPAEYALLLQKRAAAITAGAANITLVQEWDFSLALGKVDLNSAQAQDFKARIVAAAILTQTRADTIFS